MLSLLTFLLQSINPGGAQTDLSLSPKVHRKEQYRVISPHIQSVRKWSCDLVSLTLALIFNCSFPLLSQILHDVTLIITYPITTLAAFQFQSLSTLYGSKTIPAVITLVTAIGGFVKTFSSLRLTWKKKFRGTGTELCNSSRFVPRKLSDY